MNPPRYKCNAKTETFLKLWFSFCLLTITDGKMVTDWNQIDWGTVEVQVFKLQKRIYRASQSGDVAKVHKLQRLLLRSWYARLLAVRRISQDNQGKHTAGIDGYKSLSPKQRLILAENLRLNDKGYPLSRVWIPKPGRTEKRGLGIPTMEDRARQSLLKLGLEPEWEAKFEPNSYGFRPGRSCHDAGEAIHTAIVKKPKYVLDADIAKCFDRINHEVLLQKLNTTPTIARQIRAWLKSGMLDRGDWMPTNEGTPQGGVISPLLANIALHGLEEYIKQWAGNLKMEGIAGRNTKRQSIALIRYADDFVVLHKDKSVIQQAKGLILNWLHGLGLELKESKTRICHTLNRTDGEEAGFNFLGWNIRQYPVGKKHTGKSSQGRLLGFKTIIKPSKESVKTHYQKIVEVLDSMRGKSQETVIGKLNPIIKGWTDYHSAVCSKKALKDIDYMVYNKLRRWVQRRHPNKTYKWCSHRYWHRKKDERSTGDNWVFSTPSDTPNNPVTGKQELRKHVWTSIVRYTKVKGTKSPFDGDWRYWSSRRGEYPGTPTRVAKLLKRQKGKCTRCGLYFEDEDVLEIDHIVPKAEGGKDQYKNYQLLHRHCHHEKTAEDKSRQGSTGKASVC
jgi:RNA-directed DNA polymerase